MSRGQVPTRSNHIHGLGGETSSNNERDLPPFLTVGVLVGGVAGGLIIVISIILFCKYCMKSKSSTPTRRDASAFTGSSPVGEKSTFLQYENSAEQTAGIHVTDPTGVRETGLKRSALLHDQPSTDTQLTHLPSYEEENDIDYAFAQYKENLKGENKAASTGDSLDLVEMGDWVPGSDKTAIATNTQSAKKLSHSASAVTGCPSKDEAISCHTPGRAGRKEQPGETDVPHAGGMEDGKRVSFLLGDRLKHSHTLPSSTYLPHPTSDQHSHRPCRYTDGDYHHLKSSRIDRSFGVNTIKKQRSLGSAGLDHALNGMPTSGAEDILLMGEDAVNESTPMLSPARDEARSPRTLGKAYWKQQHLQHQQLQPQHQQQVHVELHNVKRADTHVDRYRGNVSLGEPYDGYRAKSVDIQGDFYHAHGSHGDMHSDSYRGSGNHIDKYSDSYRAGSSYGVFPGNRQHRGKEAHVYYQQCQSRNSGGLRPLPEARTRRRLDSETRQCSSLEIVVPKDRLTIRENRRVKSYEESIYPYDDYNTRDSVYTERGSSYKKDYDDELQSKVRYNDTGSLEDVNDDNAVLIENYSVDDNSLSKQAFVDSESDTITGSGTNTKQYRELWNLRATLEEEEDFSDTIRMEDMTSPEDQSTEERDRITTSVTTSFESNTEPVADTGRGEPNSSDETAIRRVPINLLDPNLEAKRQNYRGILTNRLKRQGRQKSADNSFDSVETMETDGDVSDTSRVEVTTTSFESTTDNTDSTGESNAHKLQQMQRDSGYKSLETQNSQNTQGAEKPPKKQIHFVLGPEHKQDKPSISAEGRSESLPGYKGKPPHKVNHNKPYFDRKNAKTASKKRRDYRSDRQAVQLYDTGTNGPPPEPETDSRSDQPSGDSFDEGSTPKKFTLFSKFMRSQSKENKPTSSLSRDYSMDEKTSALFNEFIRTDTQTEHPYMPGKRSPKIHSRMRLQRKHGHVSLEIGSRHDRRLGSRSASLGSDGHNRSSFRRLSPQDSIEEEYPPNPLDHGNEHGSYPDGSDLLDNSEGRHSSDLHSSGDVILHGIPIIRLQDPEDN